MDTSSLESESDLDIESGDILNVNPEYYVDEGEEYFDENDAAILVSGNSLAIAKMLLSKSRKCAAKFLKEEILNYESRKSEGTSHNLVLYEVLDLLLDPRSDIIYPKTITWLKWILAGGATPRDFYRTVEQFDNPTTCSLVWVANFMAFRCRTCGISPCMSLCLQCFKKGNHQGHDYNMFRSQAGGACDCGNLAVMNETGFCSRHQLSSRNPAPEPPSDLLLLTKHAMPKILLRFIFHCRFNGVPFTSELASESEKDQAANRSRLTNFDPFVEFLQELSRRGAAMRRVMTEAFCSPEIYANCIAVRPGMKFHEEMLKSMNLYYSAIDSISFGEIPPGYEDISTLHGPLIHTTFLEEILFWMLKYEFPQQLVCLLLNMRPDPIYEDAFARAFVQHYSRISVVLLKTEETDPVSHRVVHVSVQLFSDQELAYRMTDSYHLLHIMVISVKKMMNKISVPSTLHDLSENVHKVVNCSHDLMKHHCYWPLVSDLNNILSHEPIAKIFMSDSRLLKEWFSFLSYFQGMNNNLREMNKHVEHEPYSYYAAFSAELEVSASPLWAMLSHLKDERSQKYTLTVLRHCVAELRNWFKEIGFSRPDRFHHNEATFHLPLHRNFALFLFHAVKKQGVALPDVLPDAELLTLMLVHPLRAQVAFHEIINNLWVRNGLQIRGQAMTYIQCHFCNSMFDPDLFLLQLGAGELSKDSYLLSIIERFHVLKNLSFSKHPPDSDFDDSDRFKMLEACLVFLCILMTNRHNLGLSEEEITEREIIALTCTYDKTHSRLMEYVPEKCVMNTNVDFDAIVKKFTTYKEPECQKYGTMREGLYVPRDFVWKNYFDPIMILTRCMNKKEYQSSLNRFKQYCKTTKEQGDKKVRRFWPPYRLPSPVDPAFKDPRRVLACRTFHGILFTLLYKALHDSSYTENMLSLIIFLLELAIHFQLQDKEGGKELAAKDLGGGRKTTECPDGFFYLWFSTDDIFKNSVTRINRILLNNYITFQASGNDANNGDSAMEEIENEVAGSQLGLESSAANATRALASGTEMMPYQEYDSALVPSCMSAEKMEFSPELSEDVTMQEIEDSGAVLQYEPESSAASSIRALPSGNEMVPYQESATALVSSSLHVFAKGNEMVPFDEDSSSSSLVPSDMIVEDSDWTEVVPNCSGRDSRRIYHTRRSTALSAVPGGEGGCANTLVPSSNGHSLGSQSALMDTSQNELAAPGLEVANASSTGQWRGRTREYLNVYESLISLLIKLHRKLSDRDIPYRPEFRPSAEDSRIGDGAFFIAKVLNKLGQNDEEARKHIIECLGDDYTEGGPPVVEEEAAKEEKKKKAKAWQEKVMASFSEKQKKFLAKNMAEITQDNVAKRMEEEPGQAKEYDCVICNQSNDDPFGLIVFTQPTSVHGIRITSSKGFKIPTSERERSRIRNQRYTLARHMKNKAEIFNQYFKTDSWLSSMDLGWEGGMHVQTCGHYLHFKCHKNYVSSLQSQQLSNESDAVGAKYSRGEFHCPFCRHIANSVIPVFINDVFKGSKMSSPSPEPRLGIVTEIDDALKYTGEKKYSPELTTAINTVLNDLKKRTPERYRILPMNPEVNLLSKFVFLSSVFRTNLELELVHRGGTLVNQHENPNTTKRSSLIPVLHVLAYHAKQNMKQYLIYDEFNALNRRGTEWIRLVWASLTQRNLWEEGRVVSMDREVPMLFRDPVSILIHMMLLLPSSYLKTHYNYIVSYVYRLVVAKSAVSALRSVPEDKRAAAIVNGPLAPLLALVYNNLRDSLFFRSEHPTPLCVEATSTNTDCTCEVRETCLEFLRLASVLKAFLMGEQMPSIADPLAECGTLEQYLDVWNTCSVVNTAVMGRMCGALIADSIFYSNQNSTSSPGGTPVETQVGELAGAFKMWCSQVAAFASTAPVIAGSLLTNVRFYKPCLLNLPSTYDDIFQFYHQRKCSSCGRLPINPGVCLICGTLVSMQQPCCAQSRTVLCVDHAKHCGSGTGIFLVILKAIVIVILEDRICLWGCIHLDSYGEEDKDLKRGKTLFLSQGRYQLLQDQFINLNFINTPHKWVSHIPTISR